MIQDLLFMNQTLMGGQQISQHVNLFLRPVENDAVE